MECIRKSIWTIVGVLFIFSCISALIGQLNAESEVVIAPEVEGDSDKKCSCSGVCIGLPGRDGRDGQPGLNGRDGAAGPTGPAGRGSPSAAGQKGEKGDAGGTGRTGVPGQKGENGQAADQEYTISTVTTNPGDGSCTARNRGQIYLNTSSSHLVVCDGSDWKSIKLGGTVAVSCKDLYDGGLRGSQFSKSYELEDPRDGSTYKTYCDMSSGGGGWTLVGRACGQTTDWAPKSTNWYNNVLLAPDTADDIRQVRSMKNKGWITIKGRKVKVCYKGPRTSCAVFTHNLGIPLSQLFASKFGVTVTEKYDFRKLKSAFHIPYSLTFSKVNHQWCGLNVADGCNHATNPNVGNRHTICRIGCIGDYSGKTMCRLDDFALGIGVSSCYDGHSCGGTGTATKNLHYRDATRHGFFSQTAFIYVQ